MPHVLTTGDRIYVHSPGEHYERRGEVRDRRYESARGGVLLVMSEPPPGSAAGGGVLFEVEALRCRKLKLKEPQ